MSNETDIASFEDLRLFLVGADMEFIGAQLEKKATLDQARSTWMETLAKRASESEKRAVDLEAKIAQLEADAKAAAKAPGVEPDSTEPASKKRPQADGSARSQWNALIAEKVAAGVPRQRAVSIVARQHPELREAMVAEANK